MSELIKSNKEKYRELCRKETSIPLFSKDWWLDATCGENNWDVSISEQNGNLIGTLPYIRKRKYGFYYIINPVLTPRLGIWLKYPAGINYVNRLSFEKKTITDLINSLPSFHWFDQCIYQNLTNWLPFYWQNFKQTTKYTYLLEGIKSMDEAMNLFSTTAKRGIRKASEELEIQEDLDVREMYRLIQISLKRQRVKVPFSINVIQDIDKMCKLHNCGKALYAVDKFGKIHSASYIAWDNHYLVFIAEGNDYNERNSFAKYLLTYKAIELALKMNLGIDFEGSMLESVEHINKQFGARQIPYFELNKINTKILKLILLLRA